MTARTPIETVNLATLYDEPEMPWSRAVEALGEGSLGPDTVAFLGTVGADGRPHSAGVGVVVLDTEVHFTSGTKAYKSSHLAEDPRATVSLRLDGIDLVLEGTAAKVAERDTLERAAQLYAAGGWPASVDAEAPALIAPYSAQSAGPGPWALYRFTVDKAIGVGLRPPHGASRWVFSA
ncbi:hypothetical protein DSM104299_00594 [Baekduia alba]|uniref:pyridoxamine 5'-phosphate oxidase family protein n=1 Tax=Baekduia alba TaxID=2997333 RepID=UPI002340CF5A|nr:pyridoxamine 5'-phosphate oxidase family protein [Baekduia alba]WCB91916.1 hypothetical protein DSM104299_00594 [Baekduia alba]